MLYLPFRIPPEFLESFLQLCPELGIRGLSVTIPHKEKILRHVNVLDDQSAGIRAINTVVFKSGSVHGFNTDCSAAIEALLAAIKEKEPDYAPSVKNAKVLILGAGGAARAIAFGLKRGGANVTIAARNHRQSESLASSLDCKSVDWTARANFPHQILINCTPVGMHPNMDETPFDGEWFDRKAIVFDTIYNPEQTLFIKQARLAGCFTVTGVDMFVRQAARQYKLFTGKEAELDLLRYEVKRATSAAKY